MATMQELITTEIGKVFDAADLAMVTAPQFGNTGHFHAVRGTETVLRVRYDFQGTYSGFTLTGPAVERAPAGLFDAPVPFQYDADLAGAPGSRAGLTLTFRYLEYAAPGEITGLLEVIRQLLGGTGAGGPLAGLVAAALAVLPPLALLGDFIGNEYPGKTGYEPFDRCALILGLRAAITAADPAALP